MITPTSDRVKVSDDYFGVKLGDYSWNKRIHFFIWGATAIVLAGFVAMTAKVVPDNPPAWIDPVSGLAIFGMFVLAVILYAVGINYRNYRNSKMDRAFEKAYNVKYDEWYVSEMVPFLERKYGLKFSPYGYTVFHEDGADAKTSEGKMTRVKVGGIEIASHYYRQWGFLGGSSIAVPRLTSDGDLWLTESVKAREIDFVSMPVTSHSR